MAIDQKTTAISNEKWNRLEVEWNIYYPHLLMPDGTFHSVPQHMVTLVHPSMKKSIYERVERVFLVNLSPQTALNLLAWLEQEKPLLQALASHDHDEEE